MVLSVVLSIFLFLAGIGLLVYSVEKLVKEITKVSVALGVSTFILAVVFAGMDFENWGLGIAAVLEDLPGIAIGSVIGSALFLVGVSVAIAGLITPFEIEIPRAYLLLMMISPLTMFIVMWDGVFSRPDGIFLLLVFGVAIYYLYKQEAQRPAPYLQSGEVMEVKEKISGWGRAIAILSLLVAGIAISSDLAVWGARGIVVGLGFNETIFGMTMVGFVASLEEILLVVKPVRAGKPQIASGNIVGSLIFFATGNAGLLALIKPFTIDISVLQIHWPFFFITILLVGIFLWRKQIKTREGLLLGTLYFIYWLLNYGVLI